MVCKQMKIILRVVLFFTLLSTSSLFSVDPNKRMTQYDITVYTAKDGLPMNSLKKVFQDSRDYIWIGTQEGLVRFDGEEFKLYDKSKYPGLTCNFIMDIAEDSTGNLWLATWGGGISCFDGANFVMFDTTKGLVHNIVNKIFIAKDSTIWAGTENGLSRFKNGQFKNYGMSDGLCGMDIRAILEDRQGNIIIGCSCLDFNIVRNDSIIIIDFENSAHSLHENSSGEIIIGTLYGELFGYKNGKLFAVSLFYCCSPSIHHP